VEPLVERSWRGVNPQQLATLAEGKVMTTKINLNDKFGLFTDHWRPKVVAGLNGQEVKIIKVKV
jgi:hypothetical protein